MKFENRELIRANNTFETSNPRVTESSRGYDGVICFGGEDWWYHNRGHYDLQMMREISRDLPVLYVNSIGTRMPRVSEGKVFLKRITRKLRSLKRGFVSVHDQFAVLSPVVAPGRVGLALTGSLLAPQVRRAARKMGIRRPLVWIACPPAAVAIDQLDPAGVIYQRTDRHECFAEETQAEIAQFDDYLKARADLTVFCSRYLYEEEAESCRAACFVDHGVDYERFAHVVTTRDGETEPADIASLPHPRVGFVGGIDAHTFDPELFLNVARRLHDFSFIMVGACSLEQGWCELPNVSLLGRKPYEEVARYMAACDVLIMPWNHSRWIEACNPVKLKEYLATGRPIVSTSFPELERFRGFLRVADTPEKFAEAIRCAIDVPGNLQEGRDLVKDETWSAKARQVVDELIMRDVSPQGCGELRRRILASHSDFSQFEETRIVEPLDDPSVSLDTPDVLGVIGRGEAVRSPRSIPLKLGVEGPEVEGEAQASLAGLNLQACVILAGGLTPSPLVKATGLSILDLPITENETLLEKWIGAIRAHPALAELPIRVIHDRTLPVPHSCGSSNSGVSIECELNAYRGAAGILRDLFADSDPDQSVLVVEASRYPAVSIAPLLADHLKSEAALTLAINPDQSPAGAYVAKISALALTPDCGFVDLKEQGLRGMQAHGLKVSACTLSSPGLLEIRRLDQLLAAARHAKFPDIESNDNSVVLKGLQSSGVAHSLRLICHGALIGPGAQVIDSIIMSGAIIAPGAVVVRSLVCPETHVQSDHQVADAILSVQGCLYDQDQVCAKGLKDHA